MSSGSRATLEQRPTVVRDATRSRTDADTRTRATLEQRPTVVRVALQLEAVE